MDKHLLLQVLTQIVTTITGACLALLIVVSLSIKFKNRDENQG